MRNEVRVTLEFRRDVAANEKYKVKSIKGGVTLTLYDGNDSKLVRVGDWVTENEAESMSRSVGVTVEVVQGFAA